LSSEELEAIIAVAEQLRGGAIAAPNPTAQLMLDAIAQALNHGKGVSFNSFSPQRQAEFRKKLPMAISFFNENFRSWDSIKIIQIAFTQQMMILLRDDLSRIGIKPTYTSMFRNLHRLNEVFENAFPRYLASGLGELFVKRLRLG